VEPPLSNTEDHRSPRWLAAQQRVEAWRRLGASGFLCRAIQFGILEQPSIPFTSGDSMNPAPQTPEDLAFGREDLRAGCQEGIYEQINPGEAEKFRKMGGNDIIELCGVAGWTRGTEGAIRSESVQAVQTLAEGQC
jgi:hypothetical protein